jgi:hypothetical protein
VERAGSGSLLPVVSHLHCRRQYYVIVMGDSARTTWIETCRCDLVIPLACFPLRTGGSTCVTIFFRLDLRSSSASPSRAISSSVTPKLIAYQMLESWRSIIARKSASPLAVALCPVQRRRLFWKPLNHDYIAMDDLALQGYMEVTEGRT